MPSGQDIGLGIVDKRLTNNHRGACAMIEMPLIVVAAALVRDDGAVLIQRRPAGTDLAGHWEFPGGKIEAGETAEQALVRELEEELGVAIKTSNLFPLGFATGMAKSRPLILLLFGARLWEGEATPIHASELNWVHIDALKTLPMPAADVPLIAQLRRYLEGGATPLK